MRLRRKGVFQTGAGTGAARLIPWEFQEHFTQSLVPRSPGILTSILTPILTRGARSVDRTKVEIGELQLQLRSILRVLFDLDFAPGLDSRRGIRNSGGAPIKGSWS